MAGKQQYTATIELGDGKDILTVDMLNLPYDMFGPDFPLEIIGPVDMGKCKGQPLPNMTDVVIYGEFDCSTCTINSDTVLPKQISTLICKHSINNLDVLVGILPLSLKKVVVRPAIINAVKDSIKKNATDDSAYQSAIRFMDAYPNIMVTDGKKTLAEIIQEHKNTQEVAKPKIATQAPITPQIEAQTDDWLSVNDLVPVCEEKQGTDLLACLDKDLKRYIRQALTKKSNMNVDAREMKRSDGTVVKCIHKDDIVRVVEYIVQSAVPQDSATATEPVPKKKTVNTSVTPKATTEPRKYYIDNREIERVKIKKYISKAAWGQILSKVGKNITALLDILQDIENINVNPALAHTASGQVVFIKDGAVQVSPTVGFKNARCLAQGFGTLDDRPRIVWGICGNTFVCQNFYPAHEGKVKLEYNTLLRTIDIDITKIDLKEYLLVTDLIKEIKATRPIPKEEVKPTPVITDAPVTPAPKSDTAPVAEIDVAPASTVAPDVIPAEPKPETKVKRPRIVRGPTETRVEVPSPVKIAVDAPVKEDVAPVARPYKWASLYHLNGRLIAKYNATVRHQQELLQALSTQTDTEQLLQTTQKLQQVLETKKKIEDARKELEQKNDELFDFIDKIHQMLH